MKVNKESENVGLKLNIQKTKIMASDPITSWQIDGETVADFIFEGSRWVITALCLSESWRSFLYSSSVYSCHLFLISSASVRSVPFLSFIAPIFAWNVPLVSLIFLKRSLVYAYSLEEKLGPT